MSCLQAVSPTRRVPALLPDSLDLGETSGSANHPAAAEYPGKTRAYCAHPERRIGRRLENDIVVAFIALRPRP